MPSPPKPWERAGVTANDTPAPTAAPSSVVSATSTAVAEETAPSIPARPSTLAQSSLTQPNMPSTLANNPYTSPYASTLNRFGTSYSPYSSGYGYGGYGSYGGYGNMYGGYGGFGGMGYGGMGFGGMQPGLFPGQDPNQSLTARLSLTTQATFQLLQSVVQTFGGFAQMLESTYMATHSSFFAMVGVIDQFAALRDVLGQVLGLFGLIRWVKGVVTGEGIAQNSAMSQEFQAFVNRPPGAPIPPPGTAPKPSKKPLIFFFLAVFGIPYLMHKLIRRLAERAPLMDPNMSNAMALQQIQQGADPSAVLGAGAAVIDPSKLAFAHALYAFQAGSNVELNLAKGDIIAVLSTNDPVTGLESEWWKGRTRDGREGWFPRSFVELIQKKATSEPEQAKKVD